MNPTSFSEGPHPRLLNTSEGAGGGYHRWFLNMSPINENNTFQFGLTKSTTEGINSISRLEKNEWRSTTVVFNNGEISIFVDGTLDNKTTFNEKDLSHIVASTLIGSGIDNSFFNGKIDDIAIWNRALTEEEIQWLYNQ